MNADGDTEISREESQNPQNGSTKPLQRSRRRGNETLSTSFARLHRDRDFNREWTRILKRNRTWIQSDPVRLSAIESGRPKKTWDEVLGIRRFRRWRKELSALPRSSPQETSQLKDSRPTPCFLPSFFPIFICVNLRGHLRIKLPIGRFWSDPVGLSAIQPDWIGLGLDRPPPLATPRSTNSLSRFESSKVRIPIRDSRLKSPPFRSDPVRLGAVRCDAIG